jgi:hypothetical protein
MGLSKTTHRLLFVLALGAGALHAPITLAQTGGQRPERPLAESLHGAAKEAYTAAGLLHNRGEYAAAAIKYEEAYDLSKEPRLLFNIAACEKDLRKYARMGAYLRRFKEESGDRISSEDRKIVDDALARLKDYVGSVSVAADTAGAGVSVDGEAIGTTPLSGPLVLDVGKHTVSVRGSDGQAEEKQIDVTAGSAIVLTFDLARPPSATAAPAPEPTAVEAAPAKSSGRGGYSPLVFGGFGVAGVGLLLGGVTGVLAFSRASSVKSACQGTVCPTSIDGDLHDARTLGDVSTIAFAAAGVGAVVGLTALLLFHRAEAPPRGSAWIAPWIGPAGGGVRGSF